MKAKKAEKTRELESRRIENFHYWIRVSKSSFRRQIAGLQEVIKQRVLPTFASIDHEAEQISETMWERLNAMGGPDSDAAAAAEAAENAGVAHYMAMVAAQQGLLNLFAVALYHLVEQQQLMLLRHELISSDEHVTADTLTVCQFVSRLATSGIQVEKFDSWSKIEELRYVANTVKHAEGKSAKWLRTRRPEIFTPVALRSDPYVTKWPSRWVFQPLCGEDLYVTAQDLNEYFHAAESFWRTFEEDLRSKAQEVP